MSPRIRQVSDAEVLAAAAAVFASLGARATLSDIAAAAGIAPPTLIQRYGSKRALLLLLARQGFGSAAEVFAAARAIHGSRVEALIGGLCECASSAAAGPAVLAMRALQSDLADADFREIAGKQAREWQEEIRSLLDESVLWGELQACDCRRLATLVQATYSGAIWMWAVLRQGTAADSVRGQLEMLLAPYRT